MIYLYAEELEKILKDRTTDIDLILLECLQEGFMDMIRHLNMENLTNNMND
jgi:hypothetical protein